MEVELAKCVRDYECESVELRIENQMSNSSPYYCFDLETFPNCFLFSGKWRGSGQKIDVFEISSRRNDKQKLLSFLNFLKDSNALMVGFNNLGFDYPIIDNLLNEPYTFDALKAYQQAQKIIDSQHGSNRSAFAISFKNRKVPQLDLWKMNHFDNASKTTSLKVLECAMRSQSVEDLPFPVGTILTPAQIDELIKYNIHDITETEKFLDICQSAIDMRIDLLLTGTLFGDVLNYSDVKIGEQYLVKKIGREKCYSGPKPRQTIRSEVHFRNIILPKIEFQTFTCHEVLEWFRSLVIYPLRKGGNPNKKIVNFGGLEFHFGLGGVHASAVSKVFHSDETYVIKDIDVSGMYPAVAIANDMAPEHLGKDFVHAYKQIPIERKQYKKGTTRNKVLKLSANGVYGKSNDIYSCFYDPQYTFSTTVNGQLQALQLVERLCTIPGLELIQANTDGITARIPRNLLWAFDHHKKEWESDTKLELEEVEYKSMWVRDVNNYVALKSDGSVKLKGAYWYPKSLDEYEGFWNKDYSSLVVQKCAELMLLHDMNPEALIGVFADKFDFMKYYKAKGESRLFIGDKEVQKTTRYYVSTKGEPMKKIDPPRGPEGGFKRKNKLDDKYYNDIMASLPPGTWDARIHTSKKATYQEVHTSIEAGYKVKICNNADDFDWNDVDYKHYIEEIKKLYIGESNV